MELREVKKVEDIKQGDKILVTGGKLKNELVKAQSIKVSNDGTEVVIDKKKNRHFNVEMYLAGESWVKNVMVVVKK